MRELSVECLALVPQRHDAPTLWVFLLLAAETDRAACRERVSQRTNFVTCIGGAYCFPPDPCASWLCSPGHLPADHAGRRLSAHARARFGWTRAHIYIWTPRGCVPD